MEGKAVWASKRTAPATSSGIISAQLTFLRSLFARYIRRLLRYPKYRGAQHACFQKLRLPPVLSDPKQLKHEVQKSESTLEQLKIRFRLGFSSKHSFSFAKGEPLTSPSLQCTVVYSI